MEIKCFPFYSLLWPTFLPPVLHILCSTSVVIITLYLFTELTFFFPFFHNVHNYYCYSVYQRGNLYFTRRGTWTIFSSIWDILWYEKHYFLNIRSLPSQSLFCHWWQFAKFGILSHLLNGKAMATCRLMQPLCRLQHLASDSRHSWTHIFWKLTIIV